MKDLLKAFIMDFILFVLCLLIISILMLYLWHKIENQSNIFSLTPMIEELKKKTTQLEKKVDEQVWIRMSLQEIYHDHFLNANSYDTAGDYNER